MRRNLPLLTLCICMLTAVNAQMAPARSDAYHDFGMLKKNFFYQNS